MTSLHQMYGRFANRPYDPFSRYDLFDIGIGEGVLNHHHMLCVCLLAMFVMLCAYTMEAKAMHTDWPMDRGDPQMTGRSPLKANMQRAPEVIWRHYLGLWTNHFVVEAQPDDTQAHQLTDEIYGQEYLSQHAVEWGLQELPVDLNGRGKSITPPQQAGVKIAKLLPNCRGLQRVEFDNAFSIGAEANYGRLYAYDTDSDEPRLVWQTERVKDMYSPVVAIADTDLDGQDEIVMMTQYHLAVYDALTGKEKDSVQWNVGRNYGQLDVIDVDGDGRPDFVIQADAPPHLEFIRNTPDGARLEWSHKYLANEADVAVPTHFALHNLPNALRDLDGDGRIELAVNIHDFKQDRRWHVVVFDVLTGEVKLDLVDHYLWAVADLDADGRYEFFLSSAPDKSIERDLPLIVATYQGDKIVTQWGSDEPGRFCLQPYFFPLHANSASSRGPVHHSTIVTGDVDGDGAQECFVMQGQQLYAIGPHSDGYSRKFMIQSPSSIPPKILATRSKSDGKAQVLVELHAESGVLQTVGATVQAKSHYPRGNFQTTPTVADIDRDGQNEIIVEDAAGFIQALEPPTRQQGTPSVRWRFQGSAQPVWVTWKTAHAPVPAVDLDDDGKSEILCSDAGNEPHTTIYALRADGSVYWKSEFSWLGPRLTETFKVGRFRPEGWDVLVTVQETTQPEMLCLDGRTGAIRWHKKSWQDAEGRSWPYPNQYICFDANGDGLHEIYGSYAYIYYPLDGVTGEPLRKPLNIWHEVFDRWQSYFAPLPADFNGDGKMEFLLASYSFAIGGIAVVTPEMEILWQRPLDNSVGARGFQGVGDCDGDGIPDIAFYHLDGRIVVYDGRTGDTKWEVTGLTSHGSNSGGHFISGDIDADGRDEFLYPLGSNEIIAVDHDTSGHVLWRTPLPAQPETPVLADIDGDGLAELLVCTSDGYLNVLK